MDLQQITDINKLNELYVENTEALIAANQESQMRQNNIGLIRERINQVKSAAFESEPAGSATSTDSQGSAPSSRSKA